MAEYIEREAVIEFIRSYRSSTDVAFHMEEHLHEIPAVDVALVKSGGDLMYIGMNNYEYYIPEICDGHYCCRDCEKCPWADEAMEHIMEAEGNDNERI